MSGDRIIDKAHEITPTTRTQLARLCILRLSGIAGVLIATLIAHYAFELQLPFAAIGIILIIIGVITGLTWLRLRHAWPITDQEVFFQLTLDVVGLGLIIYFSGGSTNPFVSLLLFPLLFATTLLPSGYSWLMAGLTVLCYTLLLYWYIPLDGETMTMSNMEDMSDHSQHMPGFRMHIIGMWFNFVVSAGLIASVAVKMMESIRSRDRQLAIAREETLRNERILALGTMAAGAAHELGTPLSTIAITCKELQHDYASNKTLHEQLSLIRTQVDQCKQTLSALLANTDDSNSLAKTGLPVDEHVHRIVEKCQLVRPNINVELLPSEENNSAPIPIIRMEQTLEQALLNLLNNAADASPDKVQIKLQWTQQDITFTIYDYGPGISDEALKHVGKAFFTTKSPEHGFGVGLYLANATIERFGGQVRWFNRDGGGAVTQAKLPLSNLRPTT